MSKHWLRLIAICCTLLVIAGCSDEEDSKKSPPKGTKAKPQTSEKIAALPLLKSAVQKLQAKKGSTFTLIGSQRLSLQGESNPATNQIDLTGEEAKDSATSHLQGTINHQKNIEIYLTKEMTYEKLDGGKWTKRSPAMMQRKPADSLLLMNKIIDAAQTIKQEKGLKAEKQGSVDVIKIGKVALESAAPELLGEVKTYQQTALDKEIQKATSDKKTNGLSLDDISISLVINAQSKEITKFTSNIKTSFQLDSQSHVVDEEMEKAITGSLTSPVELPSDVSTAQEIK